MSAILGGAGAALCFAIATLTSSRSSRLIGATTALGWVSLIGFCVAGPVVALGGTPGTFTQSQILWLAVSGTGNVVGLLFEYGGLRIGKVAVVSSIASSEGAIAAILAVLGGERLEPIVALAVAATTVGVMLVGLAPGVAHPLPGERAVLSGAMAALAAIAFGASLYATGKIGQELPFTLAVLPARVIGVAVITLPLMFLGRLRMTDRAAPYVVVGALAEIGGFASFAWGARGGIAVSSVLVSQFATIAAILAWLLFRERLSRLQLVGIGIVAAGVVALALVRG